MNLVDKLLLVLLLVILPIGIYGSHRLINQGAGNGDAGTKMLDPNKLEQMIDNLSQQQVVVPNSEGESTFDLWDVAFATASGKLTLRGKAPHSETSVLVSVTMIPRTDVIVELGSDEEEVVKGSQVITMSVVPKTDGGFTYVYDVDEDEADGLVELRLEQEKSVMTVRFDLKLRKQVF